MMNELRVMAWNLKHAARPKAVPPTVAFVLAAFDIDVALFNEYVDQPNLVLFGDQLAEAGYTHRLVSPATKPCNQVLAVSRLPLSPGDISSPATDADARSNWLHVVVDGAGVELIGLRIPAYEAGSLLRTYRADLCAVLDGLTDRPVAIAGDFNLDPFTLAGTPDAPAAPFPGATAFTVRNPTGRWSYTQAYEGGTSRIDHVMSTPNLEVSNVGYRHRVDDIVLAGGPKTGNPISDHAALCFTVRTAA